MATEVKLPDLGEGAEDATISRWLVKEGDEVSEGDVLMEVATDKVDTEVPAPAAGTILKINHSEGSLVGMDEVLLVIGEAGEEVDDSSGDADEDAADEEEAAEVEARETDTDDAEAETDEEEADEEELVDASENGHAVKASPVAKRIAEDKGIALDSIPGTGPGGRITKEDVLSSADGKGEDKDEGKGGKSTGAREPLPGDAADIAPLSVYRLAANYNINLADIAEGRPLSTLTRYDVMSAIASRESGETTTVEARFLAPATDEAAQMQAEEKAAAEPDDQPKQDKPKQEDKPAAKAQPAAKAEAGAGEELVKHSRMRAAVAKNTTASIFTAPHVTTMWDVEMSGVLAHRKAHRGEFAKAGVNLTVTAYLVEAIVAGLKAVPAANASWTDEGVIIKRNYNIGMAVALPADEYGMGGLIVPVIKNVQDLNLQGIARAVNDYAEKARNNELRSDDLQGGTFTLSNYGTSGSRFQTPVIVQPQVGILGVGAIEKRPIVVSNGHPLEANTGDHMAFLPMTTLGFSYDHRVLDGATADAFCAAVKEALESYHG